MTTRDTPMPAAAFIWPAGCGRNAYYHGGGAAQPGGHRHRPAMEPGSGAGHPEVGRARVSGIRPPRASAAARPAPRLLMPKPNAGRSTPPRSRNRWSYRPPPDGAELALPVEELEDRAGVIGRAAHDRQVDAHLARRPWASTRSRYRSIRPGHGYRRTAPGPAQRRRVRRRHRGQHSGGDARVHAGRDQPLPPAAPARAPPLSMAAYAAGTASSGTPGTQQGRQQLAVGERARPSSRTARRIA